VLLIGIDYRGDSFLYGLADVIRVAHVDFVDMTVNTVALPRDLLVEAPEGRFTEQNPMKINQAYLFGTEGWQGYLGEGNGANSLAEVIRYNFGVTPQHYAVVNFNTVVDFIDAIGGVEVNLPEPVYDPNPGLGSFPAGVQTLNGERALALMRIRTLYSDSFRVGHQNMVIKAIVQKLTQPAMLVKVPGLLEQFKSGFLTDLSIEQITSLGMCFLKDFNSDNLKSAQIPQDLLSAGRAFIPSLNGEAFVYRWDQRTVDWIHQNLITQ
jgi:LCP family protein required for cell wall assembly